MRGQRLRNASLDVLGQPAPTGACGRHICSSTTGVCASVWAQTGVGLAVHAWTCVDMCRRAWAHTKGTEGVRCGVPAAEEDTAAPSIGRYTRLRATDTRTDTQRTTSASFSSGARRWSMRMGAWRGRTFICLCLISLSTRSAQSRQAGERLGWCPHRVPPAARPSRTSAHDVVA